MKNRKQNIEILKEQQQQHHINNLFILFIDKCELNAHNYALSKKKPQQKHFSPI